MSNYFERCCQRISRSTVVLKTSTHRGLQKHVYHAIVDADYDGYNLNDILAISKSFVKIGQHKDGSYHVYFNGVEVPLTNEEKESLYERVRIKHNVSERESDERVLESL